MVDSIKSELRQKRDILINKIRTAGELPGFEEINLGSYAMYLGVQPLDKEYDIDVGLRFNINKKDFEPIEIKEKIHSLLKNHTEYGAIIKNPCVTVSYKKDGEIAYHVDLVVYSYEDKDNHESQMYLARGKKRDSEDTYWEKTDPLGLIDYINGTVEDGDDREQFRRIVRYLKRWKNLKYSSPGNGEPPSIGLTLCVLNNFSPSKTYSVLEEEYKYDDLTALINICNKIQKLFYIVDSSDLENILYRLKCNLPYNLNFESNTDVFRKMTDIQMTNFKRKLENLINKLEEAKAEPDEIEQCKILNKVFGEDFDIPEVNTISQKQMNYIPSSSASGCK